MLNENISKVTVLLQASFSLTEEKLIQWKYRTTSDGCALLQNLPQKVEPLTVM
jgi:hypothetical protein